jgi:hypothetical protein
MPKQVVNGALLKCSFGAAPSSFVVLPMNRVTCGGQPAANIMDHIPMTNIVPFGMCSSIANPTVASATSAAMGTLTPMPCMPNTPTPWTAGAPTVPIGGMPALDDSAICMCTWGGVIKIVSPGQVATDIP